MLTALSTALSALNGQSTAIDVVGSNLANLNTVGYKANSAVFYDLMSQTIGGGKTQIGMGIGSPLTQRIFSQGSTQISSGPLDVAIQGDGFLIVKNSDNATMYTRAGNLTMDANGTLRTATGEYVQGWSPVNGQLSTTGAIGSITVPQGSLKAPVTTQNMSISANLDATAPVVAAGTETASNVSFSTSMEVYDSLGASHMVTLDFWNNGAGAWAWQASVPSSDVSGSAIAGSGTLAFDSTGTLTAPVPTAPPAVNITGLIDGANDMTMNFNLYDGTTPLLTQYSQTSASSGNSQDGSPSAKLTGISMGDGGIVIAHYSDGQQLAMGQLAMADFINPDSLLAVGNNNYVVTGSTSNPSVGIPDSGGRGQILGGNLEASTVDIATEFTNLMVYQRGYEANAKVVTSADQINQDTINLIR
jgi:flagellar hook protein FlgE